MNQFSTLAFFFLFFFFLSCFCWVWLVTRGLPSSCPVLPMLWELGSPVPGPWGQLVPPSSPPCPGGPLGASWPGSAPGHGKPQDITSSCHGQIWCPQTWCPQTWCPQKCHGDPARAGLRLAASRPQHRSAAVPQFCKQSYLQSFSF